MFQLYYFKSAAFKLLLLLLLFTVFISLFIFIAHEILWEKEAALDTSVSEYITQFYERDDLDAHMTDLSLLASSKLLVPAYLTLIIWFGWVKRRRVLALYILSTGLSGSIITFLLKLLFRRPRPEGGQISFLPDFSFPSGHSSAAFIFYGLLIYLLWRTRLTIKLKYAVSALLFLLPLLIGLSRICLRVHYASDVLAGFCIGAAWLCLSIGVIDRTKRDWDRVPSIRSCYASKYRQSDRF